MELGQILFSLGQCKKGGRRISKTKWTYIFLGKVMAVVIEVSECLWRHKANEINVVYAPLGLRFIQMFKENTPRIGHFFVSLAKKNEGKSLTSLLWKS